MARITPKQSRFIEEYLIDLNATQAAIRAGYSEKTAQEQSSRLLSNVMVQNAIEQAQNKRSERCQISQDDVIKGLLLEAQREGDRSSHSARVSAWAALGKHLGMFKEKVEVSGDLHIDHKETLDLSGLTLDELEQLEALINKSSQ